MTDLAPFSALVPLDHGLTVVVTVRAGHTPHATVVNAGVLRHPVTGDPTVGLVAAGGTHDDWDAYDRTMREERRTAVLIAPTRVYSNPS